MKRLRTSDISTTVAMPIKAGTLEFIQDANKELAINILTSQLGFTPQSGVVYILHGLRNSTIAPIYTVSSGAVLLDGEVYDVDAFSFTTSGANKAYPILETTQFVVNADPVLFTDGTPRNVHDIRKLKINNTATNSGINDYDNFVTVGVWQKGDTKEIVVTPAEYARDFTATGLGRLGRTGWANMNGNNGTPNDDGLVVIANGVLNPTLGATGGSADSVLVSHNHFIANAELSTSSTILTSTNYLVRERDLAGNPPEDYVLVGSNTLPNTGLTSSSGVSGVGKNMQPFVNRLRIMKL